MASLREERLYLAQLCRDYSFAWQAEDEVGMGLLTGMIVGQCALIYRLDEPAGLVDLEAVLKDTDRHVSESEVAFRREVRLDTLRGLMQMAEQGIVLDFLALEEIVREVERATTPVSEL